MVLERMAKSVENKKEANMKFFSGTISIVLILMILACQTSPPPPQVSEPQADDTLLWVGDGNKGMSLGILPPEGHGLSEDRAYLPSLIQGVLVSNITRYSAISVLDRIALDRVIEETLDDIYEENFDIVRLGHVTHVDYWLTGQLISTTTGYTLQLNVTDTSPAGRTLASYSTSVLPMQINDQTAIQMASLGLLEQMGVTLTAKARNELSTRSMQHQTVAQAALAQGIAAQRRGAEVAALSYFMQAAAFDPTLLEAVSRSQVMSVNISSGNIGVDTRNDILWRRDWVVRLIEAEEFFHETLYTHEPFHTLFYSTGIQQGRVDFQRETVELSFPINLRHHAAWMSSVENAAQAVLNGLTATGRQNDWGLANWPWNGLTRPNPFASSYRHSFFVVFELVNEDDRVIGRQTVNMRPEIRFNRGHNNRITMRHNHNIFNDVNFTVNVFDITYNLTIRIASVNGVAPEDSRLQIIPLPESTWQKYRTMPNLDHFVIADGVLHGFSRDVRNEHRDLVILSEAWGEPTGITQIRAGAFFAGGDGDNRMRRGVRVYNIGTGRWQWQTGFLLTSVTIGDGITHIGRNAFNGNVIETVVLGNDVVYIGAGAFVGQHRTTGRTVQSTSGGRGTAIRYEGYTTLKSITIGSHVSLASPSAFSVVMNFGSPPSSEFSFTRDFQRVYENNGRRAGTYTRYRNNRERWSDWMHNPRI